MVELYGTVVTVSIRSNLRLLGLRTPSCLASIMPRRPLESLYGDFIRSFGQALYFLVDIKRLFVIHLTRFHALSGTTLPSVGIVGEVRIDQQGREVLDFSS